MEIELVVGGERIRGELYDHAVSRQFAELLPIEMAFDDFHGVEKVATLAQPLDLLGVPEADEPQPGEIGYYGPTQGLVLYYASPGHWPGLVRMGRFDYDLDSLRTLPDRTLIGLTATAGQGS